MSQTINFRADDDTLVALARLTADGTNVSTVVREAVIELARVRDEASIAQSRARVRAQAAAIAGDPAERAEALQILADVEAYRAR